MHLVLLHVVNLWGIAESRACGTEVILKNYISDPLVLASVSRRWSEFITSSPQLWSYLLIDTDDEDVLEYLQLFLQLSRNAKLFIVFHGSGTLCDAIVVDLLRVGDRIGALVYPPNVSHSTLAKYRFDLRASHDQFEHVCRWYMLEVQSDTQPQRCLDHYTFPTSIQSLWMGGLFPLPRLMTLSHFQSLSFLSVRIIHDRLLPPTHKYRLELPKLEVLRVQMALGSHDQVDTPINMICGKLKLFQYRLELDLENPQGPATWMKFGGVVSLEEMQIDLAIHNVERLELVEKMQQVLLLLLLRQHLDQQRKQQWEQWEWPHPNWKTRLKVQPEELEKKLDMHLEGLLEPEELGKLDRHLDFMMSMYRNWRKWLNLPKSLTHIQQSSLGITISSRVHQEASGVISNMVEDTLVWGLPQVTNLNTPNNFLPVFPKYLRNLRIHGFTIPHSFFSITLPSLVSFEIIADSPDQLLVMGYIKVPQLRILRVQVEDGPGTLHKHDWGHTMNNLLDHISLRIEIPRDKQGNHTLVFHLPQTHSLHIFSPYISLRLYLAKPAPLSYTLSAGLGTSAHGQVRTLSAMWNEKLVTEWINPCGIPGLATLKTLISLQRIVLSQRPYVLSEQSPADTLLKLLEQNIDTCPQLNSITLAQCPSSWPRFLSQLRKRNRETMLLMKTKCIEELEFYQPLHATIIRWLVDAINARLLDVKEWPPIRKGNAWPMRPFKAEGIFRSCYVCHITGMELGCLEYEIREVDCGRKRGEGSKILVR